MVREPVLRPLEDPTAEYRATIRDMSDAVRQRITRKLTVLTWLLGITMGVSLLTLVLVFRVR